MSRLKAGQAPTYRLHKPSGQAIVTLAGKDFYLGPYRSKISLDEYDRLVAEYLASGRQIPVSRVQPVGLTVNELLNAYRRHIEVYYRDRDGKPDREQKHIRRMMIPITRLYGATLVAEFGPLALRAVRQHLIREGLSRKYCNNICDTTSCSSRRRCDHLGDAPRSAQIRGHS